MTLKSTEWNFDDDDYCVLTNPAKTNLVRNARACYF